jgi:hypothetical protein
VLTSLHWATVRAGSYARRWLIYWAEFTLRAVREQPKPALGAGMPLEGGPPTHHSLVTKNCVNVIDPSTDVLIMRYAAESKVKHHCKSVAGGGHDPIRRGASPVTRGGKA